MKHYTLHHRSPCGRSQDGAALAISLIMLLLLTILGITAMQTTTTQERMAGNARERNNAFQVGEAGLSAGETYLGKAVLDAFSDPDSNNDAGLYLEKTDSTNTWYLAKMSNSNSSELGSVHDSSYAYVVEELSASASESLEAGLPGAPRYYRITARGTGPAGTGVVLLQSTYKR